MAAPQPQPRPQESPPQDQRAGGRRGPETSRRQRVSAGHRRFFTLVVVPVLLMLGSVYAHTVAAGFSEKVAKLEGQNAGTRVEGENLEVRLAELSSPDRVLGLARKELDMREPDGMDLRVYGGNGEDVSQHGGEQAKEEAR